QYRAALRCMDRSLGDLFQELDQTPEGRRTVVAVVGDHGEQFGLHGLMGHGQSLYRQVLHVPFIIRMPKTAPQRASRAGSTMDLDDELVHLLRGDEGLRDDERRSVLAQYQLMDGHTEKAAAFCLIHGKYHLIRWNNGREELYDVSADFDERHPLP